MSTTSRPGRNDPCHCGSGRKYKKCCLAADEAADRQGLAGSAQGGPDAGRHAEGAATPPRADTEGMPRPPAADAEEDGPDDDAVGGDEDGGDGDAGEGPSEGGFGEWQPPPIPEATPEARALADAWWQRFKPVYRAMDLDAMHALMDEVFAAHPEIVPHLYLHEECLLEWKAALCDAGRWDELVDRLRRLRRDFPLVYDQVFYYMDPTLATGLLATGRAAELGSLLDRFAAYPDADSERLETLLDILLAANRQEDAFALARAVTLRPAGLSDGPGLAWAQLAAALPVFEQRSPSDAAAADLTRAYATVRLPWPAEEAPAEARRALEEAFAPLDWSALARGQATRAEARSATSHFWVWLHDTQGLSWAAAAFFADRVRELYDDAGLRKRVLRSPLGLTERTLDGFIGKTCSAFLAFDGVRALALLQALWFYADFLVAMGVYPAADTEPLRQACRALQATVLRATDSGDAGPHLFARFPEYAFASPPAAGPPGQA